ncbi:DUF397 domain-containing protein [Parafrankia sp. BMG5.11]|uniref:DUF397 domain-containing protein n=1 Tax=Parafrankia sp. BMG5.11 TaxID=222540 RepID=UPI000DA43BEF|nr:DUF397 domain-containing protein [Parafrankia sp. BMG5.11]TCJ31667.1 DUF397 domain-containing protein [Parafrankia sp. BMG5.11]SQD98896.1 conserved hypothetical protein [Parafrankia sp. Ea1.12]
MYLPALPVASWQAPSTTSTTAVDAVWLSRGPFLVLLRSSLTRPIGITPAAWADFVAAVKAGEFDGP